MQRHVLRGIGDASHAKRTYATSTPHKIFAGAKYAEFLAAAGSVASLPTIEAHPPEIIVTGRANVGKSTLLNAVLGRKDLLHTSKKAGRTQTLNFYRVGPHPPKLILVDAPGYGSRGRPEWGKLFDHYVENRQELKRIFLLINASHGLKDSDRMMLQNLNKQCEEASLQNRPITLQAVLTKCDVPMANAATALKKIQLEVFEIAPLCLPAILTAVSPGARIGIDKVRDSILDACGIGRVASKVQHTEAVVDLDKV